jgi:4-amino-4-deoxy-L-arabinose transferase-like glycosyltransferase
MSKDLRNTFDFKKYVNSTVLLGLVLLIGITLRFYDLSAESYWIDEMYTVIESQQSIYQIVTSGRLDQPPAYYLPFYLWVKFFGTTEVSTRSFSTLAGIGSIVLVYLIGRELFGKPVGLLSAFIISISWFHIYYSQIARFYSFFGFTSLMSILFFILSLKRKKIIYFFLYGITSVLMVYSHTYGVFILAVQFLFFIIQVKKYKDLMTIWLIFLVLILLAISPYLYPLIFGMGGIEGAVVLNVEGGAPPSLSAPLRLMYYFVIAPRRERGWDIMIVNYVVAGTLLVMGTWLHSIRSGKNNWAVASRATIASLREMPNLSSNLLFVSLWLLIPILIPFFFSYVIGGVYQDRYMISATPALCLLIAVGMFSIRKIVPMIVSVSALAIIIIPGLHNYYATDINEQWKEVAIYIEENAGSDDVLVFFAPKTGIGIQRETFDWYYHGNLSGCDISARLTEDNAFSEALTHCISGHNRFWLIIPSFRVDSFGSFFFDSKQTAIHLVKEKQFVWISVYLFELTK